MDLQRHIVLPDTRVLAYAEFGAPDGHPVLYFHGSPSSRLEPLLIGDDALRAHGLRVIAPDRPGIGGSTFQSRRGFGDWPHDVLALADRLGLRRFSVLGNSGGGPYAAVCAARIPERLRSAIVVSGGWRMDWPEARAGLPLANRITMTLAKHAPWLLRPMLRAMAATSVDDDPVAALEGLRRHVPPEDFAVFAQHDRAATFGRALREALRHGARGAAWDLGLYQRNFDFDPAGIAMPMTFFHGARDGNAPIALARRAVGAIPGAELRIYPEDAHLSVLCARFDDIASALLGRGDT